MRCEESFITTKPIWYSYLVSNLGKCDMKLCTGTGLRLAANRALCVKQPTAPSQALIGVFVFRR